MKEVAAPRKATVHIQKTAPGPPKAMAVATPPMLPMPTRLARDIISDWKDEVPSTESSPSRSCLTMSGIPRTWTRRVRMVKYRPATRQSPTSGIDQMKPLAPSTSSAKDMGATLR